MRNKRYIVSVILTFILNGLVTFGVFFITFMAAISYSLWGLFDEEVKQYFSQKTFFPIAFAGIGIYLILNYFSIDLFNRYALSKINNMPKNKKVTYIIFIPSILISLYFLYNLIQL